MVRSMFGQTKSETDVIATITYDRFLLGSTIMQPFIVQIATLTTKINEKGKVIAIRNMENTT